MVFIHCKLRRLSKLIKSIEDLNKAISLATRRGNVLVTGYVEMLTFAFSQATEHGNSNSFTLIRGAITQFAARPSGMSRKRLDGFVRDFSGFVFDTDSQQGSLSLDCLIDSVFTK